MKYWILVFLTVHTFAFPENIYKINSLKENAEKNFTKGNIKESILAYQELVDKYKLKEGPILLNYAQLLILSHDSLTARGILNKVIIFAKNKAIKSKAYSQAALIEFKFNKNKEEAIELLQNALICDDQNEIARQNLFILLKLRKQELIQNERESKNTKVSSSNKSQGGINNIQTDGQIMEMNEGNNPGDINAEELETSNFDNLNLPIDKAKQILEAMQKNEVQYIQQLRRREEEIDTNADDRPDW